MHTNICPMLWKPRVAKREKKENIKEVYASIALLIHCFLPKLSYKQMKQHSSDNKVLITELPAKISKGTRCLSCAQYSIY